MMNDWARRLYNRIITTTAARMAEARAVDGPVGFEATVHRYNAPRNAWYDRLARWFMIPTNHLFSAFPELTTPCIERIGGVDWAAWVALQTTLVFVAIGHAGGRLWETDADAAADYEDWTRDQPPPQAHVELPASDDACTMIEWVCNHFDVYDLLTRDPDTGYLVVDTTFLAEYERTAGDVMHGGRAHLRLTADGFACVEWFVGGELRGREHTADANAFIASILLHMTVCSHALRTHTLVSVGVAQSSARNLLSDDPLRRVLLPTELGVYNGVGRALMYLVSEGGLFHLGLGFTYAGLQAMTADYIATRPVARLLDLCGGAVFAPGLALSEVELQCPPFRALHAWHGHCRALAVRAVAASGELLHEPWALGAVGEARPAADVVTLAYMNLVFHNLQSNRFLAASLQASATRAGQAVYPAFLRMAMSTATDMPWPTLAVDLTDLAPAAFGDFYREPPPAEETTGLYAAADIELSTGL